MKRFTVGFSSFVLATVLGAGAASASPILFQADATNGTSFGRSQFGIATRITVSDSVDLTNIGVAVDLANATDNLNYFIFDSTTGTLLFQSGAESFTDDGMTFKVSNPFSFTLNPGTTYAIGAVTEGSADYAYVVPGGKTENGITSLGGNQNAHGFLSPTLDLALAGTDGELQLFGTSATAVPEPATLSLLGLGLAGLYRNRRKARA